MNAYQFGKMTSDETPHRIGAPAAEVFAENVEENGSWFLPLLSISLSEVDPEWSGTVHLLYGGPFEEGLTFALNDEGKLSYEGAYEHFDEEELSEREVNEGYVAFTPVEVPDEADPMEWVQEYERWNEAVQAVDEDLHINLHVGGMPLWTQGDETPDCSGCGATMSFVGQANAMDLSDEVGDIDMFGFYCAECHLQTVVHQMT